MLIGQVEIAIAISQRYATVVSSNQASIAKRQSPAELKLQQILGVLLDLSLEKVGREARGSQHYLCCNGFLQGRVYHHTPTFANGGALIVTVAPASGVNVADYLWVPGQPLLAKSRSPDTYH